ncbi:hypothetical protein ACWGOE_13965, partial [Leucobacter chromiiresistens]
MTEPTDPLNLLRVLADRAARGVLSEAEGVALRRRVEQIINGRATWKAKAEEIERDRDRIAAELAAERRRTGQRRAATQQAEAAIERVRQMTDAWEQRQYRTVAQGSIMSHFCSAANAQCSRLSRSS